MHGRERVPVTAAVMANLLAQDWPGNVRELRNAAERYAVGFGQLGSKLRVDAKPSLASQVEEFERTVIERALAESGGKMSAVMEQLGIPRADAQREDVSARPRPAALRRRRPAEICRRKLNSRRHSANRSVCGSRNLHNRLIYQGYFCRSNGQSGTPIAVSVPKTRGRPTAASSQ